MLFALLLPLLRRASARTRMLIAAAVVAAGIVLAAVVLLQARVPGYGVLLVRIALLLTLAGLILLGTSIRGYRRDRGRGAGPEQ
jgi:hypothetical protein